MHCALLTVQCAVCSVQCSLCSVQCAVCSVQCAVCSVQCVVCGVQCQCSVSSVHCSLLCPVEELSALFFNGKEWRVLAEDIIPKMLFSEKDYIKQNYQKCMPFVDTNSLQNTKPYNFDIKCLKAMKDTFFLEPRLGVFRFF